jgi:hypothetical protein
MRKLLLIHCKMHDPTHDTCHPSFERFHCSQDKIYQADAAGLHILRQQQYPKMEHNFKIK